MESSKTRLSKTTRAAQFAGKFYPENKKKLLSEVSELFQSAEPVIKTDGTLQAIISPHAGYVFSGGVAASAFNQIPENSSYKRVFVLASSHQFSFSGASVYEGNYETPFGAISVDSKIAHELVDSSDIFIKYDDAHLYEHSLEVQLPFLQQRIKNNFLLVPIIIGSNNKEDIKKIAKELQPYFNPENLFIISTDFSHYPNYNDAKQVDFSTAEKICTNKPKELIDVLERNKRLKISNLLTSLCGWSSVLTLLYLTEKQNYIYKRIDYKNSGDTKFYSDRNRVVGYWAIAIFETIEPFNISELEKLQILEEARGVITHFIKTGKRKADSKNREKGILSSKVGVFVSIYIENDLRGCIGGFPQEKTLYQLIQEMSVSAACDRRFENPEAHELDQMELEISVISPLKKIKSKSEIELGKHGIYIRQGLNKGTLLPQVALKTGWDVEEFLGHCSRDKAGLGWEGWKTAELFVYEAAIFRG